MLAEYDPTADYGDEKRPVCRCSRDGPCECPSECDVCGKYRAMYGPVCEDCWENAPKCAVCTEYPVKNPGDVCRDCDLVEER